MKIAGAKVEVKNCSFEGCSNKVQLGGACITHIAMRETVQSRRMYQQVIKGGVCVAHGAKLVNVNVATRGAFGEEFV